MRTISTFSRLNRRLWLLYAVFIIYGTTIPFRFTADRAIIANKWSGASRNPFRSGRPSIPDAVQNIMLFLPFGALGVLARRPTSRSILPRIVLVTGVSALLSVVVETGQLFTIDRTASMTDVITNTLGGLIGAVTVYIAERLSIRSLRALMTAGLVETPTFYPFLIAAVVACAAAWEPFNVTLDVSTVARRVHALQRNLWQYAGLNDEGIVVIHHALLAVAGCMWLEALRIRRAAATVVLVGVPLAGGLEASQFVITSRMPGAEDAVVGAAGIVLGAILWRIGRNTRTPRTWLILLVAATTAAAAMEMLNPFVISSRYGSINWLPFMGYYFYTTFDTFSHVLELWLLYFPLGFVFALVFRSPARAMFLACIVSLIVATPVEYGQGWIVGRFPDITDIAMCVIGGWLGAWAGTHGETMFNRLMASLRQS